MAEERSESQEFSFRQAWPWTNIFRSFRIALNPKNLLLAAGGIVVMSLGWWILSMVFAGIRAKPVWPTDYPTAEYQAGSSETISPEMKAWEAFKRDRSSWSLLYEAAGRKPDRFDASDFAQSPTDFNRLQKEIEAGNTQLVVDGRTYVLADRPYGKLATWPWSEDRGPNSFLLVTGKTRSEGVLGDGHHFGPPGGLIDWFLVVQVPVLIEPLVKLVRPLFYLLHPSAGFRERFYFLLVLLWTVATWGIFGGAITRVAAVDFARNESIPISVAFRYALARWRTYVIASAGPLLLLAVLFSVLILLVGLVNLIPLVGDLWDALLWPVVIILGVVITLALIIGLVGWPLIHVTLGAEGSDAFDAVGRCYSYVAQEAGHFIGYALVSIIYGAVLVFFVGFVGSLAVYLGKWGVASMPGSSRFNRDPSYLCVYAPTSFGWRDLLLEGSPVVGGKQNFSQTDINEYVSKTFHFWNYIGAFFVAMWLYVFFLMIVGFGYSYFWSASTIIYFLMRRKVDDVDLDEVYLEEDAEPVLEASPAGSAAAPSAASTPVQMVEPPTLPKTSLPPSEASGSNPGS